MKTIAIIGTAGRGTPLNKNHWEWMLGTAREQIGENPSVIELVSGGAAWADHLAVVLYMEGACEDLTLHLPAPWNYDTQCYEGPYRSAASAANYYHSKFSDVIGRDTLLDIQLVLNGGAVYTEQPYQAGYGGMFARNSLVADVNGMLAFTFGEGDVPADGGTKDTWDKCQSIYKQHHSIPNF